MKGEKRWTFTPDFPGLELIRGQLLNLAARPIQPAFRDEGIAFAWRMLNGYLRYSLAAPKRQKRTRLAGGEKVARASRLRCRDHGRDSRHYLPVHG